MFQAITGFRKRSALGGAAWEMSLMSCKHRKYPPQSAQSPQSYGCAFRSWRFMAVIERVEAGRGSAGRRDGVISIEAMDFMRMSIDSIE